MVKLLEGLSYGADGHKFKFPIGQPATEKLHLSSLHLSNQGRFKAVKGEIGSSFQMLFPRYGWPQTHTSVAGKQ